MCIRDSGRLPANCGQPPSSPPPLKDTAPDATPPALRVPSQPTVPFPPPQSSIGQINAQARGGLWRQKNQGNIRTDGGH
eukprot:3909528-Rhodomonas_salina.1